MNEGQGRMRSSRRVPSANPLVVGALLGALLGLFGAYLYQRRAQEVVHAVQHPLDGARRAWQRYWGGRDLGFPARD